MLFTYEEISNMLYDYKKNKAEAVELGIKIEEGILNGEPQEVIDDLKDKKERYERIVKRIDNMVGMLKDDEQEFINLKFFCRKKDKDISMLLNLSTDGIQTKRRVILVCLMRFLNGKSSTNKKTEKKQKKHN